jgi:hypothetical protein
LIGQCEYNEGTGSYSLTGWYFGSMAAWFLHENTFLNQILGYCEKNKRRNGLFVFVNRQEW